MADQPFLASNSFNGDGVQVVWEFSFEGLSTDAPLTAKPYIDSADVRAEFIVGVGDDQITIQQPFLFETANSLRIEPPVPVGTVLRIYRVTENRFPLVNYQDLQSVGASDLDLANRQAVYIVQEARDAARGAGNLSAEALAIAQGAAVEAGEAAVTAAASAVVAEAAAVAAAASADGLRGDLAEVSSEVLIAGEQAQNLVKFRPVVIEVIPTGADQTAELIAYLNALGPSYKGTLFLPFGIKFDRKLVTQAIPVGVVIFDQSQYANDSPGETNKAVGFMSSDVAENDTHFQVSSGHHAIQYFNNYGTSGTTSGDERKASVLWGAGNMEKNPNKKGPRGILAAQFTKESGLNYWIYAIRSLAPWLAADGEYEDWTTAEAVGVGVYRRSGNNHYVSTTSGTTGATAPTHTTGTASDGAVSWQWVDSAFRTMYMIDQYGRVAFNAGSNVAQFNHKTQITDPLGPNNSHHQRATGVSGDIFWRPFPTDASSVEQAQPYVRSGATSGTRWITAAGNAIVSYDNTRLARNNGSMAVDWVTAADGDTTPSVLAVSTLRLLNTGATSITALDDPVDGQRVTLVSTNANTTLVHSSTLMLSGSINVTLTAFSSVTFERVPSSISARWIEVARSIK